MHGQQVCPCVACMAWSVLPASQPYIANPVTVGMMQPTMRMRRGRDVQIA